MTADRPIEVAVSQGGVMLSLPLRAEGSAEADGHSVVTWISSSEARQLGDRLRVAAAELERAASS
jgi:hypothetical protein